MVMLFGAFFEFGDVEEAGKLVEVEHRLVFAVLAKKRDILAEIHILEMVCDKTAIATLDAFAEFI